MIAAIWIAVAAVNLVLSFAGSTAGSDALTMLGTNLCGLSVSLVLSSAIGRLMRHRTRPNWPALSAIAAFGGSTVWLADATLQFWATHTFGLPPVSAFLPVRYNLVYFLLIFALQTAATALLSANDELAHRERQLADATFSEQQARLAALQLQLNPHFLFNALNALATLAAEGRNGEVSDMVNRMSGFLRAALSSSPQETTTLADELDTTQAYLDIESIRFGDRLQVRFDCEPALSGAKVPGLILQPLVENAVKHAVVPSAAPVAIEVRAVAEADTLLLRVADYGSLRPPYAEPPGLGIGLENVSARLLALYGSKASFDARLGDGSFVASIRLPLRFEEAH
ncbi:sensor histidine kinase [Sphingomonas guangdongensis]|uniref:sensor histidine kinase n=1 Tax=Sphingomonas guangdongensis TaxID=1141890 RepID=UPI0015C6BA9D|nr:histidine kinase [Sphingomonas guangdongensis]